MIRALLSKEFDFVSGGDGQQVSVSNNSGDGGASSKVNQAVGLINQIYGSLTDQGQQGFDQIQGISIDSHDPNTTSHVDLQNGIFHIDANEADNESVAYIASTILHDGYHIVQYDNGTPMDTVPSEQQATQVQIDNANHLGLNSNEVTFLQRYHDDTDAIQCRLNQSQGKPCDSPDPSSSSDNNPSDSDSDPGKGDGSGSGGSADGDGPNPGGDGNGGDGSGDSGGGDSGGGGGGDDRDDDGGHVDED